MNNRKSSMTQLQNNDLGDDYNSKRHNQTVKKPSNQIEMDLGTDGSLRDVELGNIINTLQESK